MLVCALGGTARADGFWGPQERFPAPAIGRIGVGASLGAPTGLSVEAVFSKQLQLDAAFGRNAFFADSLCASAALTGVIRRGQFMLLVVPVYLGLGGSVRGLDGDEPAIESLRMPFGVRGESPALSFQMFAEIAFTMDLNPFVEMGGELAIGFRYFL